MRRNSRKLRTVTLLRLMKKGGGEVLEEKIYHFELPTQLHH